MTTLLRSVVLGSVLAWAPLALQAQAPTAPAGAAALSPQQLSGGLKTGLEAILKQALGDGKLSVEAPAVLSKVEAALSKGANADKASGFGTAFDATINQVAPKAKELLQSALKDMKVEDPTAVLAGGPDAATQYLKKNIGPAVREKLLPIVKQASASSGLATKAKDMLAAAGPLAGFGGNKAVADLDAYVCDQVLAQGFALMAKQEAAVRANPALLKDSPLAQQVFALFKK